MYPEKTILIAEDDDSIKLALRLILELEGYHIYEAHDGDETRDMIKKHKPDLILLDIMMPPSGSEEGIRILSEIKQHPQYKKIPVFMLTVKGSSLDKKKALQAGAKEYITKPFNTDELIRRIAGIFAKHT